MSNQEEIMTEEELREVYEWVDTFELSRMKRNISRDFSDSVLMAEILHVYNPKLVQLHNFSAVNSYEQKVQNWNLLKKKVLRKIHFKITDEDIISLVRGDKGFIEVFLLRLKRFLEDEVKVDKKEKFEVEEVKRAHRTKSEV